LKSSVFLFVAVVGVIPAGVHADSARTDLRRARSSFVQGRFAETVRILRAILYPRPRLVRDDDIVAARELLGVSHFLARDFGASRDEFERLLLEHRPSHRLDPLVHPPDVIDMFDKLRDELTEKRVAAETRLAEEAKRRAEAERLRREEEAKRLRERREYLIARVETRSKFVNLLPFGAGQFQNGETGKGAALLVSQVLMLGANIASYVAIEALRGSDGRFAAGDVTRAKGLQTIQLSSVAVFGSLVLYGVIDAFARFNPARTTFERLDKPPKGYRPPSRPSGAVTPWFGAGRDGAGAGLTIELPF
jgi:hypothetical protein